MKNLLSKTLLALGLTLGAFATAQTPIAFKSVTRGADTLSATLSQTWTALNEHGYSGAVREMTDKSVTYVFTQGERELEVTLRQTDSGVLVITKDWGATLFASR
jgi:hypothetical protein